jgi:hypothetical protein
MPEGTIGRRLESGYRRARFGQSFFSNMSMSDNMNWRALDRF